MSNSNPLFRSVRPQPRPHDLHTQTKENDNTLQLPERASEPPQSRPDWHDSDDTTVDVTALGAPELERPEVRQALKDPVEPEPEAVLSQVMEVTDRVLFGDESDPDERLEDLSDKERADMAFEQRVIPATITNATSLYYGPKLVDVMSGVVPDRFEIPAKIIAGSGAGRFVFPPAKQATDEFHEHVLDEPIVDPAVGIFSDENLEDMLYAVPSTAIGMGAQALTTTALTALGVTNPIGLTIVGLGVGSVAASKGWAMLEEQLVPAMHDYAHDTTVESIDVEKLTGVPESSSGTDADPISIEELEALWDAVADQIPAAEAEALKPSVGALAPDSWTMADIAAYEDRGVLPEVDPELEQLLVRNGLAPTEPVVTDVEETVDTAVLTSPRPAEAVFRTVRTEPDISAELSTAESVLVLEPAPMEPAFDVFVSDDEDDDGPDPQCLVPFWLLPWVDELASYGVKDFCQLKDLTPDEVEDLLDELVMSGLAEAEVAEGELNVPVVPALPSDEDVLTDSEDDEGSGMFCPF